MSHRLLLLIFLSGMMIACTKKFYTNSVPDNQSSAITSPQLIIYKTRSDYHQFVPVQLSPDKSSIVAYPDVKDIYYHEKLSYPTPLSKGFLLDNRGIGPNVAFLNITYEEYSGYNHTPSADELWKRIIDKDPVIEMYQCGPRSQYADPEKEISAIIDAGKLDQFKKIK